MGPQFLGIDDGSLDYHCGSRDGEMWWVEELAALELAAGVGSQWVWEMRKGEG